MKILDTPFEYKAPNKAIQPRCDLKVYRLGRGQEMFERRDTYVVVFAEPVGYEGVSVTNAAEYIATQVWALSELRTGDYARVLWIEHYPPGALGHVRGLPEESFDLVTFDWERTPQGPVARRPVWRRVSREWVEELVGEPI